MPTKGAIRQLSNLSNKNITLIERGDTVSIITIDEDPISINKKWDANNKLEFLQQAPESGEDTTDENAEEGADDDDDDDDVQYVHVQLTRDNSNKDQPKYFGSIEYGLDTYQIVKPSVVEYTLYKSNVEYDVKASVPPVDTVFTEWRKLSVTIIGNVNDHTFSTKYKLNGVDIGAILVNQHLSYNNNSDFSDDLRSFSLEYSMISDTLTGYWNKKADDGKDQKVFYFKAIPGNITPVDDFISSDGSFSLKELIGLSPYKTDEKDASKLIDKAQDYAATAFDTLVKYCMSSDWRSQFLNINQPQLEAALVDILNSNVPGIRTAKDFYKEYSIPWLVNALKGASTDDALNDVDFKRVTNYLEHGTAQDPNYINQTNLLYRYGYKKAVTRIVDYIQDQANKTPGYWAEQMFRYFSQEEELTKIAQSLVSINPSDVSAAQTFVNSVMFKMNLLDTKGSYSAQLFEKVQTVLYHQSNLEWMARMVDAEDLMQKDPSKFEDIKKYIDMLEETQKQLSDKLQKDILDEMAKTCRLNARAALELYTIACRLNVDKNMIKGDNAKIKGWYEKWNPTSKCGKWFKKNGPTSVGRVALTIVSMVGNAASMFFMVQSLSNFKNLDPSEKAVVITNLVFVGVDIITQAIAKKVISNATKKAQQKLPEAGKDPNVVKPAGAKPTTELIVGKTEPNSFTKNMKESLKTFDGIVKIIAVVGLAVNIGFTIYSLIEAVETGNALAIGMDSALIVTQTLEGISLIASLGLKGAAATANAVLGNICSMLSLGLMLVSLFLPQDSPIKQFVNHSDMSHYKFQDLSEIEAYNNFEQRFNDDRSSTTKLVNGNYTLTIEPTKLVVRDKSNTEKIITSFDNSASAVVNMRFDTQKTVAQVISDSRPLATMSLGTKAFTFSEVPMYFKLDGNGIVSIRTNNNSHSFTINSETFVPPKKQE
jgi:hypothetical protein